MRKKLLMLGLMWMLLVIYVIPVSLYVTYKYSLRHVAGEIRYVLTWDTSGATHTEEGWQFTSDLGYDITLKQGSLTTLGVQAIACEHSHTFASWLQRLLPVAFAGHGEVANSVALSSKVTESLDDLGSVVMGSVASVEPRYCPAHYLVANRTAGDVKPSLWLEGSYTGSTGNTSSFSLQTDMAFGILRPVLNATGDTVQASIQAKMLELNFERQLRNMFDGVDFNTMSDDEITRSILRNLNNTLCIVFNKN